MKKKNRKLIVQVSLLILPVFILMIVAVSLAMYNSTLDSFIEAKQTHMEYLLKTDLGLTSIFDREELKFMIEWCEKEPEKMRQEPDIEFENDHPEYFNEEDSWTIDWFRRLPDEAQLYSASTRYHNISAYVSHILEVNTYERLFILDMDEKYRGMVIYDCSHNGSAKNLGEYYELDMNDHPELSEALESGTEKVVFESDDDFPEDGRFYIAYEPVVADGEPVAVIAIVYDWNELREAMMGPLTKTISISVCGMLLALVLLQVFLFRKTMAPLARIQRSVRDYIETKDSSTVISRMKEIKERNEFGLLSDNITELAEEIDRFTQENIRLAGERERVEAELDMARSIQASQLPGKFPAFPERDEFDIFASMTPAKEVGGDFYDFFLIDDDHLALTIADVSGKGVPAALFMMMSKMLINNYAVMGISPNEVLEHTNNALCKNNEQGMFVTVWFGILEISTGKVTAANAGHEYPVIRQPGGKFEALKDKHDFVLGGKPGKKYREYGFTLEKGSTLFLYTDGVPEATDAEEKMFGLDRLVESLNRDPDASPSRLIEQVHRDVNSFVGDAPQFDDLTMMAIKLR